MKKEIYLGLVAAIFLSLAGTAFAQSPNFGAAIYADGEAWGTKAVAPLPAPNGRNVQSYDKLFIVTNSNAIGPQLPVGEAAPGSRHYNGGRWFTHVVTWTEAGFAAHGTVPLLMSYYDIMANEELGYLEVEPGTILMGGPPPYFECPLLPVK